ncbi:saccharopine dehydrogenase NADP-binding domain-containing protein [Actinomadura kijaniata]|uniref:Saccharopine dehydrogenase-like NADP-dependent oxidoreductase n=1 Tax=Actinomadura namibiensis TaxID=182080 RepID=A0A7W3LY08_ACTNM|nr:saccharopine dehydrogenase NADP-binding domain-containing protein [Actinomadura namibiensis]MBA8956420.1 saccharopine dehydrogenase-like NADP-dependent oxidoreductase [Actinomadura namibiensis]
MRVLALGGAGAMGAVAVREAVRLPRVSRVVVADRDPAAAEAVARRWAGGRVPLRPLRVDVTDADALRAALADADVVLNTVGPYYRFGARVLTAAIETGTHYLDVCDDWEPTLRMLEADGAARAAGVRAVVGMGASPGVSNLLAARAARDLDAVHDLYTAWPVDVPHAGTEDEALLLTPDGRPGAAAVHWMEQISGTVAVIEDGSPARRPPLRPVTLALPGGRSGTAYTVGHPEPVTLHRALRPTGDAACLMVVTPGTLAYLDVLRRDIDAGRLTGHTAAADLARPSAARALRSWPRSAALRGPGTLPPFFAVATGIRDGRPRTVLARFADLADAAFPGDMAEATGVPLALGLAQVLDGTAAGPGVHPPETAFDPDRLLAELARRQGPGGAVAVEHAAPARAPSRLRPGGRRPGPRRRR